MCCFNGGSRVKAMFLMEDYGHGELSYAEQHLGLGACRRNVWSVYSRASKTVV